MQTSTGTSDRYHLQDIRNNFELLIAHESEVILSPEIFYRDDDNNYLDPTMQQLWEKYMTTNKAPS